MRVLLLAVVLSGGCKDKPTAAAPTDVELLGHIDRVFAMHTELSRVAEEAGADCGEMARRLDDVVTAHAELYAPALMKRLEPHRDRFDRLVNDRRTEQFRAVTERAQRALGSCIDDAGVKKALARLDRPAP